MSDTYENVKIEVFASPTKMKTYDERDDAAIAGVIRNQVLPREKAEYYSVKVKVKRRSDGSPKYMVAYMLRKDTYTADVVRIDIDDSYNIQTFHDEYDDSEDDFEDEDIEKPETSGAGDAIDFVAATPCPEIPTAKAAIEAIHKWAQAAGLNSKILLGADATVANYKKYLKSGLRGFVNVGHGYTGGIVLKDGNLTSAWFDGLRAYQLCPTVVYFNSCKVFNAPLQPAIMNAGARTFIGGIVNLSIGPSEEVCKCFWQKAFAGSQMGTALKDCESAKYHTRGAHGISGYLGSFTFYTSVIDMYKAVVYGKDATGGNLAAYIHCYYKNKNLMTCEFYRDGTTMPENRHKGCRVGLVYPYSQFDEIIDILRNEKPLYFGFIYSTKVGYISTYTEPVGEGDEES
jgi:hypothetical protein